MRTRRLRVRTLLLLMIMIPVAGMVAVTTSAGLHLWDERGVAVGISADAHRMDDLMTATIAIRNESVRALALATAAEMGLGAEQLLTLYGVDFAAELSAAREVVDANVLLRTEPSLREELRGLLSQRPAIDAGQVPSAVARRTFDALTGAVLQLWQSAHQHLERTIDRGSVDGPVRRGVDVLRASNDALLAGGLRIRIAIDLAQLAPDASLRDLVEADAQLAAATAAFDDDLGARGTDTYVAFRRDPAVERFEGVIETVIEDGLAGRPSGLAADPIAYGTAFVDSAAWMDGGARVVAAASADLGDVAADEAHQQDVAFWTLMTVAGLAIVVSTVAVALFSRSFTRPLDRIASVVQAVRNGAFDIPRVRVDGPRELADTVEAVNDMAVSLEEASHDVLTGLLNRRAALDAIGRDMARARREDVRVMAIFIDLDGLKSINDTYGHDTGDDALRRCAEAIRRASRESDVVARLGGDEYLVAGLVRSSDDDVEALAERIREEVGHAVIWCEDTPITLRCSVGVAISDGRSGGVDRLIKAADQAMYRMKVAGRAA